MPGISGTEMQRIGGIGVGLDRLVFSKPRNGFLQYWLCDHTSRPMAGLDRRQSGHAVHILWGLSRAVFSQL